MSSLLLFVLLGASPFASAVYAPLECQIALGAQAAFHANAFSRWSRIKDVDSTGTATLLIRAAGEKRPFVLPKDDRIEEFAASSFDQAGNTYALVNGSIAALQEQRRMIAAVNGGRRLDFQILQRDEFSSSTLGEEVKRRVPGASAIGRALRTFDGWMDRLSPYRRARAYVGRMTESKRQRFAAKLQAWRNPVVPIRESALAEVRECVSEVCQAPVDADEHALFRALERFFEGEVPRWSLRQPETLDPITRELIDRVAPERHEANEDALRRLKLNFFNFNTQARATRLFHLKRAFELLESRIWPGEGPGPFTVEHIERTLKQYQVILATPRPVRELKSDDFDRHAVRLEFIDPRFRRLRETYPLTVVRGRDDFAWVLVNETYGARAGYPEIRRQIEAALGRGLDFAVAHDLTTLTRHPELAGSMVSATELHQTTLESIALARRTERVTLPNGEVFWIVPAPLTQPRFVYGGVLDAHVMGQDFEPYVMRNRHLAQKNADGTLELPFQTAFETVMVQFEYEEPANDRPVIRVLEKMTAIPRDVEVPFYKRLVAQYGIELLNHGFPPGTGFEYRGQRIGRLRMSAHAVVENRMKYGVKGTGLDEILGSVSGRVKIGDDKCAEFSHDGVTYRACFNRIMNGMAELKFIRPKND